MNAYIFPAFINELTGKEVDLLIENNVDFNSYLAKASAIAGQEYTMDMLENGKIFKDELRPQIFAYCFACAIYDVVAVKLPKPELFAGYSMGIYATLYAAGAINFETGIELILNAYSIMAGVLDDRQYGMGTVVGLSREDLDGFIGVDNLDIEIINQNNSLSFVLSGELNDVTKLIDFSREEGAMSAHVLKVSIPYHSKFLKGADVKFREFLDTKDINDSNINIISLIDQKLMIKSNEIKEELCKNLIHPLNWNITMGAMLEQGLDTFYECGAGKELFKVGRFIEGDFKIYSNDKIKKLL